MIYKLISIPLITFILCELGCNPALLVVDAFGGTFQVQFRCSSSSHHQNQRVSKSALQLVRDTKWDNLVDEDDEFEFEQQVSQKIILVLSIPSLRIRKLITFLLLSQTNQRDQTYQKI